MQCESFNLLLLGQSGVGKSTLINSIANYFTYKSFEDAKGQKPVHIIPASFVMMDSDYNTYTVSIGTPDKKENLVTLADSCTQSPKIYGFLHDKCQINFINVPGIGDVRGIDIRNKTIKAILNTVSLFDQLHAICILLKSTDTKLNTEYRFCLNELLLHLHQKAIPNVVFIFTNSQATGFVPGNARTPLNAYLADLKKNKGIDIPLSSDNMYCIDNDAFRFLCTYYQYPVFQKEDPSPFAKSWEKSQSAIKRLFKRNSGLIPHDVVHSLSINQARAIIISMIQPLAVITSLIQANSANYQTNFDDMVKRLQENLAVTEYDLKLEELPRPQTVCTGKKCTETEIINGQVTTIYKQVCHSPCDCIAGIVVKRVPEPGLINCAAMASSGNCQWCHCSYEVHMHIDYNLKKILRPSRVGAELAKLGNIDKAKATTQWKDQMERLESEQKKVSEAMVKFAAYLKKNAILEYNNAFEEKMKIEIRNEEVAVQNGADPTTLDRLNVILDNYIEQKKKMEAIYISSNGDNVIDSTEVSALQNKLFQLPLYGEKIKELYNKNTTSNVSRTQNNIKTDYTFLINPFDDVLPNDYRKGSKPNLIQNLPSTCRASEDVMEKITVPIKTTNGNQFANGNVPLHQDMSEILNYLWPSSTPSMNEQINCLTFGKHFEVGQRLDRSGNRFLDRITCDITEEKYMDYGKIIRHCSAKEGPKNIVECLETNDRELLQMMFDLSEFSNNIKDFLNSPTNEYILVKYEVVNYTKNIVKDCVKTNKNITYISAVKYGIIILLRILPKENTNLDDIIKNLNFLTTLDGEDENYVIETLVNWKDKKQHQTLQAAQNFIDSQMKKQELMSVIRYDINQSNKSIMGNSEKKLNDLLQTEFVVRLVKRFLTNAGYIIEKDQPLNYKFSNKYSTKLDKHMNFQNASNLTKLCSNLFNMLPDLVDFRYYLYCYQMQNEYYYISNNLDLLHSYLCNLNEITIRNFGLNLFISIKKIEQIRQISSWNPKFIFVNGEPNIPMIQPAYDNLNEQGYWFVVVTDGMDSMEKIYIVVENINTKICGYLKHSPLEKSENEKEIFLFSCPEREDGKLRIWICDKCFQLINYSDDYIICSCGKSKKEDCQVQCFHEDHGEKFVPLVAKSNLKTNIKIC